jgi:hypothetical protein
MVSWLGRIGCLPMSSGSFCRGCWDRSTGRVGGCGGGVLPPPGGAGNRVKAALATSLAWGPGSVAAADGWCQGPGWPSAPSRYHRPPAGLLVGSHTASVGAPGRVACGHRDQPPLAGELGLELCFLVGTAHMDQHGPGPGHGAGPGRARGRQDRSGRPVAVRPQGPAPAHSSRSSVSRTLRMKSSGRPAPGSSRTATRFSLPTSAEPQLEASRRTLGIDWYTTPTKASAGSA